MSLKEHYTSTVFLHKNLISVLNLLSSSGGNLWLFVC